MRQICVALDLETTGVRPDTDEIIEIAAVKFQGERVLDVFQTFVDPRCPLPLRTDRFTRISQSDLQGAPTIDQVASKLIRFIQNCPLVGQSVHIDVAFLARKGIVLNNPIYDTFELASIMLPELSNYNLGSVAQHLGVDFPVQHRALPDAEAAMKVLLVLAEKAHGLDLSVLSEANRLGNKVGWSLAPFFQQIEKERSVAAFASSIGEQLASKMGLEEINLGFLSHDARRGEELIPTEELRPLDVAKLSSFLQPGGLLDQRFPGYEYRPQQVEMMAVVANALNESGQVIAEAGTGTGKSLAYLLPSVAFAVANQCHVVVSTNTINLQEQLVFKDIPDLREVLRFEDSDVPREETPSLSDFQVAVLKGRSNYLCLRRWTSLRKSEGITLDEARVLTRILVWLPSTRTGDRSELNLTPGESLVWAKICAQSDNCLAAKCRFQHRGTCFLYRARREAETAHLIVVNHALLLSDVAGNNRVLPEYSHLVIDEAHHLEDEATSQFGFEASHKTIAVYLDRIAERAGGEKRGSLLTEILSCLKASTVSQAIRKEVEKTIDDIEGKADQARIASTEFFTVSADFIRHHSEETGGYDRRILINRNLRAESGWAEVGASWELLKGKLASVEHELEILAAELEQLAGARIEDYDDLVSELGSAILSCKELRRQVNSIVAEPHDDRIYWLSSDAAASLATLHEVPLHVGEMLDRNLFSDKETVVLTSATLSTEGTFEYIKERVGLNDAREVVVDSPFDYEQSTLLFVATDVPEPGKPGYQRKLEQTLVDLCRAAEGRTLVLFTSNSALRATYSNIRHMLERENILILGHGIDGSRRQLLNTFKSNPRTVLMGTTSFWEGVDVVGDALSVLVIAKLPFSVPTDPVFRARSAMFHDAFNQYAVPQTILKFKQGFGRLIRSRSDRGVVAILDSRVDTKSYGLAFLHSLPVCTEKRGPARELPIVTKTWLFGSP